MRQEALRIGVALRQAFARVRLQQEIDQDHIAAHFIDLRKLHNGPDISEAGKLADLSRFKEHLGLGIAEVHRSEDRAAARSIHERRGS